MMRLEFFFYRISKMANSFFSLSYILDKLRKKHVIQKGRTLNGTRNNNVIDTRNDINTKIDIFENSLNGKFISSNIHRYPLKRDSTCSNSPLSSMESIRYSPISSTLSIDTILSSKESYNETSRT